MSNLPVIVNWVAGGIVLNISNFKLWYWSRCACAYIKHTAIFETSKMTVFVKICVKPLSITGTINGKNLACLGKSLQSSANHIH